MERHMRRGATLATLVFTLTQLAVPASADIGMDFMGVFFQGRATMCAEANPPNPSAVDCPAGSPHGLYLKGQPGKEEPAIPGTNVNPTDRSKWEYRPGMYSITSGVPMAAPTCLIIRPRGAEAGKPCLLEVQGLLASVLGIGAACNLSSGYDGNGLLSVEHTVDQLYALSNVGWLVSAGGMYPLYGMYNMIAAGTKAQKDVNEPGDSDDDDQDRIGPFVGLMWAQGVTACLKSQPANRGPGASTFSVVGFLHTL